MISLNLNLKKKNRKNLSLVDLRMKFWFYAQFITFLKNKEVRVTDFFNF